MVNIIRSNWTAAEILHSRRHQGRPARVTAGSWVDDLTFCNVAICLCDACEHKWNPKKYNYERRVIAGRQTAQGQCDGCKQFKFCGIYLNKYTTYR